MDENEITKNIQNELKRVLHDLAVVLEENCIPFFIAFGTALGAERHSGFIPWDDDVDIYILGKDYLRFKNLFKNKYQGYLKLHDFDTIENYPFVFPKIVDSNTTLIEEEVKSSGYQGGIYIDIFPLFTVSDNKICRWFQEKQRYFYYTMVRGKYTHFSGGIKSVVSKIMSKIVNPQKAQRKLSRIYQRFSDNCSFFAADPTAFSKKTIMSKAIFSSSCIKSFEEDKYPVPGDIVSYLQHCYGDYMELPPENKRVTPHPMAKLIIDNKVLI